MRKTHFHFDTEKLDGSRLPYAGRINVSDDEARYIAGLCIDLGPIGKRWNWNWLDPNTARYYFEDGVTLWHFQDAAWLGIDVVDPHS